MEGMSSDREPEIQIRSLPPPTVRILWRGADHGQKYGPARWSVTTIDQSHPITEGEMGCKLGDEHMRNDALGR